MECRPDIFSLPYLTLNWLVVGQFIARYTPSERAMNRPTTNTLRSI